MIFVEPYKTTKNYKFAIYFINSSKYEFANYEHVFGNSYFYFSHKIFYHDRPLRMNSFSLILFKQIQ
jgi:hypothetical protein